MMSPTTNIILLACLSSFVGNKSPVVCQALSCSRSRVKTSQSRVASEQRTTPFGNSDNVPLSSLKGVNFHSFFSSFTATTALATILLFSSPVYAATTDEFFFLQGNFGQRDQRKEKAMKELYEQKAFQDARLDACIGA
jgi:hypothetical protein